MVRHLNEKDGLLIATFTADTTDELVQELLAGLYGILCRDSGAEHNSVTACGGLWEACRVQARKRKGHPTAVAGWPLV